MNTTAAAVPALTGGGGWLGGGASSCRSLFTASQWQELEHQALIFKYMAAGVPVPPDLVRNALCAATADPVNAAASRFYLPTANGSSVAYSLYGIGGGGYGKKLDPEPGRCRRTDGKKWRCSKDAHPDSKYCERHMNRGRNRSRKPVESQSQLPLNAQHHNITPASSPSTSSTITSLTPNAGCGGSSQSGTVPRSHHFGFGGGVSSTVTNPASTQLLLDSASYLGMGSSSKDHSRYLNEPKSEYYNALYPSASGNVRALGVASTMENPWPMLQSGASYSFSDDRNRSNIPSSYNQLHSVNNLGQESINSFSKQQHCFLGSQYGSSEGIKQEGNSLRPFFDELPKARDSWAELGNERSNRNSFSTTQLSISIPMTSSDFSTTSSASPNDD